MRSDTEGFTFVLILLLTVVLLIPLVVGIVQYREEIQNRGDTRVRIKHIEIALERDERKKRISERIDWENRYYKQVQKILHEMDN